MKLTDYVKRGYGRTNNAHHKNQGIGVINNPLGINQYTKKRKCADD